VTRNVKNRVFLQEGGTSNQVIFEDITDRQILQMECR